VGDLDVVWMTIRQARTRVRPYLHLQSRLESQASFTPKRPVRRPFFNGFEKNFDTDSRELTVQGIYYETKHSNS
jgi:hypothetical protein